jgi:hypothetical protein
MANAEAKKVWPAKFAAVEKSWKELASNFKDQPHSLAANAEIKASLTDAWVAGWDLDESVIEDFEDFSNATVGERKKFGAEVKKYVAQKKVINKQYGDAINYEVKQIHFEKQKDGRWNF